MFNKLRQRLKEKAESKAVKVGTNIILNEVSKNSTMNNFLVSLFGASWRTALTGYVAAIFTACWPIFQNGNFDIHRDWKNLVAAGFMAIFGNVSKDAKVTGTPEQNKQ